MGKRLKEMTSHLTKAEKLDKQYREDNSKVRRTLLPPEWLSDRARQVFIEVVDLLNDGQYLDDLDIPLLANYAHTYVCLQDINKLIESEGYTVETVNSAGAVKVVSNPNLGNLKLYNKALIDYAKQLGINSIDRVKLVKVPENLGKNDVFDKFGD